MREIIENIIKKNLPEKKEITHPEFALYEKGFNQALSQINASLIADKVLKVVVEEIKDCMYEHNEARHGNTPDDAYGRILDLFEGYRSKLDTKTEIICINPNCKGWPKFHTHYKDL